MKNNSVFTETTVEIEKCGDIHPQLFPVFPNATKVTMRGCDKNFVYYWLTPRVFPKVQEIHLYSHPCQKDVLHRFPNATIYLSSDFAHYKDRWAPKNDRVKLQ
jgi:hypothetical protein